MKQINMSPVEAVPRRRILGIAIGLAFLAISIWVVAKSSLLRPGGDDYCLAVAAQFGPVGGPLYWWTSFSGFMTPTIAANLLVGLPLLHLPLQMASAIAFLVTTSLVALVAALIVPVRLNLGRKWGSLGFVLIFFSSSVAWWSYWWLPMTLGADGDDRSLALAITHNQNPNAGHVVQTALVVLLVALSARLYEQAVNVSRLLILVSAVAAGFSGPAMTAAFISSLAFLAITNYISPGEQPLIDTRLKVATPAVALLTLVIALAAPGSRIRASQMGPSFDISVRFVGESLAALFPKSLVKWLEGYISAGTLVVFAAAIFIGWVLPNFGIVIKPSTALRWSLWLSFFGLALSIFSTLFALFAYSAFWHYLDNRVTAFFAIYLAGGAVGTWLQSHDSTLTSASIPLLGLLSIALSLGATVAMIVSVDQRSSAWRVGPAPIPGIVTELLDESQGRTCWGALTHLRDLPPRGVTQILPAWDPDSGPLMRAR